MQKLDKWAVSKDGRLAIRLHQWDKQFYEVYALYKGTHDLAPVTRKFRDLNKARDYANSLWRGRS